jgi:hypothetical protein
MRWQRDWSGGVRVLEGHAGTRDLVDERGLRAGISVRPHVIGSQRVDGDEEQVSSARYG